MPLASVKAVRRGRVGRARRRRRPKVYSPFRVTGCKACLSSVGYRTSGVPAGQRTENATMPAKKSQQAVSAQPKRPRQAVSAMAFLNMARDYADAANELYMVADARPKIHGHMPLSSPLYFLYSHAVELALKAFLTANNVPINELTDHKVRHNLPKLYDQSRNLG